MSIWIFWASLLSIFYAYFGYPLLLFLLSLFLKRIVHKREFVPNVSIIVAVHNEERIIRRKIENILALDYPRDRVEIIIVSDCSTDRTDELVKQYEGKGIRLYRSENRRGKHSAQQLGVEMAQNEIIAFTDAYPMLENRALSNMVRNFADPTIGCVTSEDRVIKRSGGKSEEGTYIKYEMLLRRLESKVCSVISLSGSFFSVRKEICEGWSSEYSSDFLLALRSYMQGFRAINDRSSIHYYQVTRSSKAEFSRKVRTVLNGMTVIFGNYSILNPFRYGFFSI